jgi:SAM-dependent methyltransferase
MRKMENSRQIEITQFRTLLNSIEKEGYSKAVNNFLRNNSDFRSRFDSKEGNIGFRAITKKSCRCLIINSDLGNIPECLSQSFDQVFSLDDDEKISIQEYRFNEKGIKNINLVKNESEIDSFPENYFDLIIVNRLYHNSRNDILRFLERIKQILDKNGCLCLGLDNKLGIKISQQEEDEKCYVSTFEGYTKILKSVGFQIAAFWALPSFDRLHYSGRMDDDISLKWFFQNFDRKFLVDGKYKMIGRFLKLFNKTARKFFLEKFSPSFIFYCYFEESPKTLEDMIKDNFKFKNLILHPRMNKIMYFLLDEKGNPRKVVTCKPTTYSLDEIIVPVNRIFPNMRNPDEKMIVEEWEEGRPLDRFDDEGIEITMKWLTEFQKKSKGEKLSNEEFEYETTNVRNELANIEIMRELPYQKWLNEYKDEIKDRNLEKTGVHGDFQVRNILVDHNRKKANIIDWDWRFQEQGNPLYDYVWLATSMMMISSNPVEEFSKNYKKTDGIMKSIKIIKDTMRKNFHTELNFIKLQRFMIMRFITIRIKDGDEGYMTYVKILEKILEND